MKDILTKEHIIKYGVKNDLLCTEHNNNSVVKKITYKDGKLFTGLVYKLNNNGDIRYYGYYKNGCSHGLFVKFYNSGALESIETHKFGLLSGIKQVRFKNGKVKSIGEYKYSICLHEMLWDERGILLKQKLAPTEKELFVINEIYQYFKRNGRE